MDRGSYLHVELDSVTVTVTVDVVREAGEVEGVHVFIVDSIDLFAMLSPGRIVADPLVKAIDVGVKNTMASVPVETVLVRSVFLPNDMQLTNPVECNGVDSKSLSPFKIVT